MNLKTSSAIILSFTFIICTAQDKPKVELKSLTSKGNFYYANWLNQFKIVPEGISRKNIIVSVTHGTLTAINDSIYSLIVSEDSSKINFKFSQKLKGKTVLIDSKRRTIKKPNIKGFALNAKFIGEKIKFDKSEFHVGASLTMVFDDDIVHSSMPVTSYAFTMISGGKAIYCEAAGDKINEMIKGGIEHVNPGKGIFLEGKALTPLGISYSWSTKILMK